MDEPSEPESEDDEDCDHSFVLKDDLGYVCRVCGVVQRGIETIFDFQYAKVSVLTLSQLPRDISFYTLSSFDDCFIRIYFTGTKSLNVKFVVSSGILDF